MKREQKKLYFILGAINLFSFLLFGKSNRSIDYRAFYSVGRLANEALGSVYDRAAQMSALLRFTGETRWIAVYHPPQELLLFSTLARLPYGLSLAVWSLMGVVFLLGGSKLLSMSLNVEWRESILVSCALFATGFAIYEGQDTLLLFFLLAAALFLLERGMDSGAAVVLALAMIKPQVPAVVVLALLLSGRRRLFYVFSGCSLGIAAASYAALGRNGIFQWLALARSHDSQERGFLMLSLRGLLSLVHAPHALVMAASVALILLFAGLWRRTQDPAPVFASAIVVGSLTAYHFFAYDAALLSIPWMYLMSVGEPDRLDYAVILALGLAPVFFALCLIRMTALLSLAVLILAVKMWRQLRAGPASGLRPGSESAALPMMRSNSKAGAMAPARQAKLGVAPSVAQE